jgi:hypothetical protein
VTNTIWLLVADDGGRFDAGLAGHADVEEGEVRLDWSTSSIASSPFFASPTISSSGQTWLQAHAQLVAHQSFVVGNNRSRHRNGCVKC